MITVGVNGYGTIGKRVAEAVRKQTDMHLIGVAKVHDDFEARITASKHIDLYAAGDKRNFEGSGLDIKGTAEEMFEKSDVVIDAAPDGIGAKNKPLYEKAGVRAVFQGGEEPEVAELSFNAYANYNDAAGARSLRVLSCNTTALLRTLGPLERAYGIAEARAVLVRRAADPSETKKGPINSIEPEKEMPSHHGADFNTVMPGVPLTTIAVKVPTTLMHLHTISVALKTGATAEDILATWKEFSRILQVSSKIGIAGTAQIMEYAKSSSSGRSRGDLYEVAVWDNVHAEGGNRFAFNQAVHQEAIVIPENIDAIRAMFGMADARNSIEMTDGSLGIPLRA